MEGRQTLIKCSDGVHEGKISNLWSNLMMSRAMQLKLKIATVNNSIRSRCKG